MYVWLCSTGSMFYDCISMFYVCLYLCSMYVWLCSTGSMFYVCISMFYVCLALFHGIQCRQPQPVLSPWLNECSFVFITGCSFKRSCPGYMLILTVTHVFASKLTLNSCARKSFCKALKHIHTHACSITCFMSPWSHVAGLLVLFMLCQP